MPASASLSSAARHLSSTAVARQLPPCDAFTHPTYSSRVAVYYYRYLYPPPPAPNAFHWKGPRSIFDALRDWISSRPGSPDVYRNAVPTTIEADCIVVLPRSATQPGLVSLNYCVLAFFVSLVLAALYFKSRAIAERGARRTSTRRRRSLRTTPQRPANFLLTLVHALWAAVSSALTITWAYLNHIAQPNSTTQKRTIELTVDQDTWLRRFTSLSAHSSAASSSSHAAPTKFTSVSSSHARLGTTSSHAASNRSVRLPPDWHDWFKRSPPRPRSTGSALSLTPRPTTPTPRPGTPLSSRPTTPTLTTATPTARPTPLSPSKSQRRSALRPKADRERDRSRSKLRPVSVSRSLVGDSLSSGFILVPSDLVDHSASDVVVVKPTSAEPEPVIRSVDSLSPPSDDDFDHELLRAASIPLPLPDIAEDLLAEPHCEDQLAKPQCKDLLAVPYCEDDASEHETERGAQKKKTRRSGRKWTRRRANAVAAAQEIF